MLLQVSEVHPLIEQDTKRITEFLRRFAGIKKGKKEFGKPKFRTPRNYILVEDAYYEDWGHLQMWLEAVRVRQRPWTPFFNPNDIN